MTPNGYTKRCTCRRCRERDMRRFWRAIGANYSIAEWTRLTLAANEPAPLPARINAYALPPVPVWTGEPRELRLPRKEG